jgi:hypothetical protein
MSVVAPCQAGAIAFDGKAKIVTGGNQHNSAQ